MGRALLLSAMPLIINPSPRGKTCEGGLNGERSDSFRSSLDIQVLHIQGIEFDEFAPGINLITHQGCEYFIC